MYVKYLYDSVPPPLNSIAVIGSKKKTHLNWLKFYHWYIKCWDIVFVNGVLCDAVSSVWYNIERWEDQWMMNWKDMDRGGHGQINL